MTLDARGVHGNCDLPAGATGLVMNVTALGPTAPTYVTLYPTGGERPTTSNLNPNPGGPPTPNAVTVDLRPAGQFDVYNLAGTVD